MYSLRLERSGRADSGIVHRTNNHLRGLRREPNTPETGRLGFLWTTPHGKLDLDGLSGKVLGALPVARIPTTKPAPLTAHEQLYMRAT